MPDKKLSGDNNPRPSGYEKETITSKFSILLSMPAKKSTKSQLSLSMNRYVRFLNGLKKKFSDSSRMYIQKTSKLELGFPVGLTSLSHLRRPNG